MRNISVRLANGGAGAENGASQRCVVAESPVIPLVKSLEAHGEALLAKAVELDIEGIVAKRTDAPACRGGGATG